MVADDTDVYILLLYACPSTDVTLYFRQGTKSSKAGISYHNITALGGMLGQRICNILPSFHALTGSDFTRTFFRRSKIQSTKSDIDEQLRADSTEFRIAERRRNENDSESSDEEYDLISEVDNSSDSDF